MRAFLLLMAAALVLAGCTGSNDAPPADPQPTPGPDVEPDGDEDNGAEPEPEPEPVPPMPAPLNLSVATSGTFPVNPGFDPDHLEAPAGAEVTLTFRNAETNPLMPHDWVLEGVAGAKTAQVAAGEEETIVFTAPEPGEYAFYCSLGGHRDAGMEGVLVVA